MGRRVVLSSGSRKHRGSFTAVLASALLEWVLIVMLFAYGMFGYVITKFARYCELPIPCLLCSRIDNILGSEKAGFYWDMICGNHKLEISSLVYCHFHEKLVDVRGMCESCLFSFATKDKSNAETYRLLVGKLAEEDLSGFHEDPLLDDHKTQGLKHCCCCNELWTPRRQAQTSIKAKSIRIDAADIAVPLSRGFSQDCDKLAKEVKISHPSSVITHVQEKTEDSLVRFGYTELKITSDTESEIHASDNEDTRALMSDDPLRDLILDSIEPFITVSENDSACNKPVDTDVLSRETSQTFCDLGPSDIQGYNVPSVVSAPTIGHGLEELKMANEAKRSHPTSVVTHVQENTEDSSVRFGDTEIKITSDTESEIHASDNEDTRALMSDDPLRDLILDSIEPFITVSEDDSACNIPVYTDVLSREPSQTLCDLVPSDIIQGYKAPSVASAPTICHGLEELNWQESDHKLNASASPKLMDIIDHKLNSSASTELIDFIDHKPDSSASTELIDIIDHKPDSSASTELIDIVDHKPNSSASTELINDHHVPNIQNVESVFANLSDGGMDIKEVGVAQILVHETDQIQESENSKITTDLKSSDVSSGDSGYNDSGLQIPNYLDLTDAYKLAVSGRGRQLSGKLTEQLSGKDSPLASADLKLLLSQFSRGFDLPSTGILSPRISRNPDELKTYDSSVSIGMKLLQKRLSLERNNSKNSLDRNESGVDSLDLSVVSEIEGESELDRLKRQVEHDRWFMVALLKELEEERNASAIAANETMAMITRLQEEKAALQMEASHDLRMMEEQAEYDMDALDKLNDLVTEKEKEIQELEAEIEYYRSKYPNESFLDNVGDSVSDATCDENPRNPSSDSDVFAEKSASISKDSCLKFEVEKEYLSECLRNLEKKLGLLCSNEAFSDLRNGDHLGKQREDSSDPKMNAVGPQVKSEMDASRVTSQNDPSISKESRGNLLRRVHSFNYSEFTGQGSLIHREADLAVLVNEVSTLNERLQALEADQSFIECATNTLKNGAEGLIQEIASHLRELREIGIKRYQSHLVDKCHPPKR